MADESGAPEESAGAESSITRCDYCRLPCPHEPCYSEHDGVTYKFCSNACRDAQESSERVFTQYHGFRRYRTKVSALDAGLPQGIPRNSFVMLTDLAGTRSEAIMAELVWRALQRGESVIYVTFLEPPVSVVQKFADLEWNVLPYLEEGSLHFIDCFTYRLEDRDRMFQRMDEWNTHLATVAGEATTTARDPSATRQLSNQLDRSLTEQGMDGDGIVVIDSLTELGTLVQPVQAYGFVKDVRAEICKGRFVPVFAGATRTTEEVEFPHDLGYMVDGIVEVRLNEEIVDGALIKEIRVRKMNGVLTFSEWSAYEYTSGRGIVTFNPLEELEKSREAEREPELEEKLDAADAAATEQAAVEGPPGEADDEQLPADGGEEAVDASSDGEGDGSQSEEADASTEDD